jgi:ketosteroid isomerase-like protein
VSHTPEEISTPEEIAEAFSSHRFEDALPYFADDVLWTLVGDDPVLGRDAVEELCRKTVADLVGVTTEFQRFRTVVGGGSVVVDSLARYTEVGGDLSVVASCDLYDFADGRVTEIVSYTIEIGD